MTAPEIPEDVIEKGAAAIVYTSHLGDKSDGMLGVDWPDEVDAPRIARQVIETVWAAAREQALAEAEPLRASLRVARGERDGLGRLLDDARDLQHAAEQRV